MARGAAIKCRYITHHGFSSCLLQLVQLKSFACYRCCAGLGPRVLQQTATSAIFFTAFEACQAALKHHGRFALAAGPWPPARGGVDSEEEAYTDDGVWQESEPLEEHCSASLAVR